MLIVAITLIKLPPDYKIDLKTDWSYYGLPLFKDKDGTLAWRVDLHKEKKSAIHIGTSLLEWFPTQDTLRPLDQRRETLENDISIHNLKDTKLNNFQTTK